MTFKKSKDIADSILHLCNAHTFSGTIIQLKEDDIVLKERARPFHMAPNINLQKCLTINTPSLVADGTTSLQLNITFYNKYAEHMMVEYHQKDQTLHNYLMNFEFVEFFRPGTTNAVELKVVKMVSMSQCDESSSQMITNCIDNYILSKLGCTPPWIVNDSVRSCNMTEDFQNYFELYESFGRKGIKGKLKQYGCLVPNCETDTWEVGKYYDYSYTPNTTRTEVMLVMPRGSRVKLIN